MGIKLIDKINAEQTASIKDKNYPDFRAGDTVRVSIKIKEGDKFRIQDFEGKVLAIDNGRGNVTGNFTVTRDTYGVRVEKLFPFASPWIQAIKVIKKGTARRAKLYNERTFCSHKAVRKLVKK
jgi:large subunit ribosomal protein L19